LLSTIRSESGVRNMHEDRTYMCASYMENDTLLIKEEEFEDTKRVIRIRKSKDRQHNGQEKKDRQHNGQEKDRQHNGQEKKDKTRNDDLLSITQKTKDGVTRTPLKTK